MGGVIIGEVEETGRQGAAKGQPLVATISGARNGRSVWFTKTYLRTAPYVVASGYTARISYSGHVSPEADEVEGSWIIPLAGSGRFLMIRKSGPGEAVSVEVRELVPAGV
ncbi:MAG: hypothetical protein JWP35_1585 [Caulobacter sp.]|nr:hypothetical protein [Caulobacter sp.]